MIKSTISILGAGNVGTHLAKSLFKAGFKIGQVYSRHIKNAKALSVIVDARAINSIGHLDIDSDVLLVCVPDSAIADIVGQINFQPKLIAHTAGSVSIHVLDRFCNCGVFYPLQSFSKNVDINMHNVPFCVEASKPQHVHKLIGIAEMLSENIYELSSGQRRACHLAAVFANNFSNHMFALGEQVLLQNNLPVDILKPIIAETANRAQSISPRQAQTGPAVRNDIATIEKHLDMLSSSDLKKIYSFVSGSIRSLNTDK